MALPAEKPKVYGAPDPEPMGAQPRVKVEKTRVQLEDALQGVIDRLSRQADDQVSKRLLIEERWLKSLRAYHGRYDEKIERELKDDQRSHLYIKLTRQKTHAWESRISDMLFPVDAKNWGISATPVPELSRQAQGALQKVQAAVALANQHAQAGNAEGEAAAVSEGNAAAAQAAMLKAAIDEAQKRAKAMETEIDDQLVECFYAAESRAVIHDMCKLGTGIMKGPIASTSTRRGWEKVQSQPGGADVYQLKQQQNQRPCYERVDPWSYFPDVSIANNAKMRAFDYERHVLNRKGMRDLAKQPGFSQDAIRDLLRDEPPDSVPNYLPQLREITGQNDSFQSCYIVWEYSGSLEQEDLQCILDYLADPEISKDYAEVDPLSDVRVVIWFCNGRLLKFAPYPLDSGDSLYSIVNFEKDPSSPFGFGVPDLMDDSQHAINGAWRMMMDNGGITAGPQVVIDQSQIEPENGSWMLKPFKVWRRIKQVAGVPAFEVQQINNNQAQFANIITMARQFADDETSMPLIAQGEQAAHITKTQGGMALLMNSANVVFRNVVRNWDDDMTVPNITRAYDWNMQFNPRDDIKGDMKCEAKGSSVLLVREMQSQNLMQIATQWSIHPVLGGAVKAVPAARMAAGAMLISPNDVLKTDEELKQEAEIQAQNPPPPDPELLKLTTQKEIAQINSDAQLQVAQLNHDTAMMQLAQQHNMKLDELRAMLAGKQMDIAHKERTFAAETALAERLPAKNAATVAGGGDG